MSGARDERLRLPAPWAPHVRCWMAWPTGAARWGAALDAARTGIAELAAAVAEFEPVTMIARPEQTAGVSLYLRSGIPVLPLAHDDVRVRDTLPMFVVGPDERLTGVVFRYDGWGSMWPDHAHDARVAERLADHLGASAHRAGITLYGSLLHHDGEGTALLSAGPLLDLTRNPGLRETDLEAELAQLLGIEKVIWLPHLPTPGTPQREPEAPYCFLRPGVVLASVAADPSDPAHDALQANLATLQAAEDAKGRRLEVVTVPLPASARGAGMGYASLYHANGAVLLPGFADPADKVALRAVSAAVTDRTVVQIDVSALLPGGCGIYALTREQPEVAAAAPG